VGQRSETIPPCRGRTWGHDHRRGHRGQGALPTVRVAAVRRDRLMDLRAEGIWRASRPGLRADPLGDRIAVRALAARSPGLEMEDRGLAAASAEPWGLAHATPREPAGDAGTVGPMITRGGGPCASNG